MVRGLAPAGIDVQDFCSGAISDLSSSREHAAGAATLQKRDPRRWRDRSFRSEAGADGPDRALPEFAGAGVSLFCQTRPCQGLDGHSDPTATREMFRSDGCRLTTPGEEVQAGHHEHVGVLEMLARRGVELV
jgi:hypothetical protein